MNKSDNTFKMGVTWASKFVSPKKIQEGWTLTDINEDTQVVCKPNGSPFALFDVKTGLVHTKANKMEVQW